jgi:hypothetical protein
LGTLSRRRLEQSQNPLERHNFTDRHWRTPSSVECFWANPGFLQKSQIFLPVYHRYKIRLLRLFGHLRCPLIYQPNLFLLTLATYTQCIARNESELRGAFTRKRGPPPLPFRLRPHKVKNHRKCPKMSEKRAKTRKVGKKWVIKLIFERFSALQVQKGIKRQLFISFHTISSLSLAQKSEPP